MPGMRYQPYVQYRFATGLLRWSDLDLHKGTLSADALDADLGAGVWHDHAALCIELIIVRIAIVEDRDTRKAGVVRTRRYPNAR